MCEEEQYTLGIDIGSTTVKIAVLDEAGDVAFSDYERHYANIQETLSDLLGRAVYKLGAIHASPVITGSGGLTLAKHLGVPFVQEVIAVSTALQDYAPQTDVAIELGTASVPAVPVLSSTRWPLFCRRTHPVLMSMRKITKLSTPSLPAAVYLRSQIFSH